MGEYLKLINFELFCNKTYMGSVGPLNRLEKKRIRKIAAGSAHKLGTTAIEIFCIHIRYDTYARARNYNASLKLRKT